MRYQPHSFHIPVMGTGFTIDTPLKVARYGISSVISLVDDVLIEQVRKFHCDRLGEPFEPIGAGEDDARARRITAYLNLVDGIVRRQSRALQAAPFEDGSEITRYFRMLPDSPLKMAYEDMLVAPDGPEKDAPAGAAPAARRAGQHRRQHHDQARQRRLPRRPEAAAGVCRRDGGPARLCPQRAQLRHYLFGRHQPAALPLCRHVR